MSLERFMAIRQLTIGGQDYTGNRFLPSLNCMRVLDEQCNEAYKATKVGRALDRKRKPIYDPSGLAF